jgi:hypothetical protein
MPRPPLPATLPEAHALIEALWAQNEALRAQNAALAARVVALEAKVEDLERRLGENSTLAPSSDQYTLPSPNVTCSMPSWSGSSVVGSPPGTPATSFWLVSLGLAPRSPQYSFVPSKPSKRARTIVLLKAFVAGPPTLVLSTRRILENATSPLMAGETQ